jgi:polysaccharide biosynthesis PFTS motif protein
VKIVFERLSRATVPVARYYLLRNHEVYCLAVAQDLARSPFLERGCLGRRVAVLDLVPWLGHHLYEAHRLAFENVETAFDRGVRDGPAVRLLATLFDSRAVEVAFKKELNRELFQFYSIDYIASVLEKHFDPEPFVFVPSRGEYPYFSDGVDRYLRMRAWCRQMGLFTFPNPRLRLPWWLAGWNRVTALTECAGTLGKNAGLLALLLVRYASGGVRVARARTYPYGVVLMAPQKQVSDALQGVDFLVDGTTIRREEVIAVSYGALTDAQRAALDDKGIAYVEAGTVGWSRSAVGRAIGCAVRLFGLGLHERRIATKTARVLVLHFCKWASVLATIRLRHLVTYCDMELEAVARNILMNERGTTTWHYLDSCNFPCYFAVQEAEFDHWLHYRAGFLLYDYFISWSDQLSEYFKLHHQAIGRYVTVGCLWAEHTRKLQLGVIPNGLRDGLEPRRQELRVVSVFDSSFVEGSPTPYADGIAFLAGVLRLLDETPDVFVVLKEKKPRSLSTHPAEIVELYRKLEAHPRCYATPPAQNPSEVIALSDVVVAFPFTSVGFEALSTRKKTVFFDGQGSLETSYYDRVPGLVCRGYPELATRIRELLGASEADYADTIKRYVEGEIVPNSDGRALTAFRQMLVSSTDWDGRHGIAE